MFGKKRPPRRALRRQRPGSLSTHRRGAPSSLSPEEWERRMEQSAHRRMRRRKHRDQVRRQRRKRRWTALLFCVLLGPGGYFGFRWVHDTFFVSRFTTLPTLRQDSLHTMQTQLLVTDTQNRSLTRAEREADLEVLLTALREQLPNLYAPSLLDDSFEQIIAPARQAALDTEDDAAFFHALREIARSLQDEKTDLLTPQAFFAKNAQVGQDFLENSSPYGKVIDSERSQARYQRLLEAEKTTAPDSEPLPPKAAPLLLEPMGSTVFLRGLSFTEEAIAAHRESLPALREQCANAQTLVIDLRGLRGTSELYWCRVLVPLLAQDAVGASSTVLLHRGAEEWVDYLSVKENVPEFDLEEGRAEIPPGLSPALQKKTADLLYSKRLTYSIQKQELEPFHGKVYVLVDAQTANAADTFASFCQRTELATVAGKTTAGGGWELPPTLLALPHSGYIVQLHTSVALHPDGTRLQNDGTEPDLPLNGADLQQSLLEHTNGS